MPTENPVELQINGKGVSFRSCTFEKPVASDSLSKVARWTDDEDVQKVARRFAIAENEAGTSFLHRPAALIVKPKPEDSTDHFQDEVESFRIGFRDNSVMYGTEGLDLVAEKDDNYILFFDNGYESSFDIEEEDL